MAAAGQPPGEHLESLAFRSGYRVVSVCEELQVTEQYFRRIFHRDVGIPLKQWMKWERMAAARRLLLLGIEAAEVAGRLGFSHANSFRREFREIYQMPVTSVLELQGVIRGDAGKSPRDVI